MKWHELHRLNLVSVAIVCTGCEAILGFGDTSLSPPADASVRTGADDDASSSDHGADAANDKAMAEQLVSTLPDVLVDGPRGEAASEPSDASDARHAFPDAIADAVTDLRSEFVDADWTPLALDGLALWLDAATGVETNGGKIATWRDRSPKGNDAVALYPDIRPVLDPRGIGSYPGVSFAGDGETLVIVDNPSLQFGTEDFVIEVVMRHTTPLGSKCALPYGPLFSKQVTISPFRGPGMFANFNDPFSSDPEPSTALEVQVDYFTFAKTTGGVPYNDDKPRLVGMYRRPEVLVLRINGMEMAAENTLLELGQAIDVAAIGAPVYIGATPDQTQCVVGVIAEIVAATHVTSGEVLALERYLSQKHEAALGRD